MSGKKYLTCGCYTSFSLNIVRIVRLTGHVARFVGHMNDHELVKKTLSALYCFAIVCDAKGSFQALCVFMTCDF